MDTSSFLASLLAFDPRNLEPYRNAIVCSLGCSYILQKGPKTSARGGDNMKMDGSWLG